MDSRHLPKLAKGDLIHLEMKRRFRYRYNKGEETALSSYEHVGASLDTS